MKFERARTDEQINKRKNEIIKACSDLYDELGYDGLNIKLISTRTSIGRSTIYTYYQTKEEILLDVLLEEIKLWSQSLKKQFDLKDELSNHDLAEIITHCFLDHIRLLDLLSLLYSTLEKKTSLEKLIDFKQNLYQYTHVFAEGVLKYKPFSDEDHLQELFTAISSYVIGLYPICYPTERQIQACQNIGHFKNIPDFETMCYKGILSLTNI